MTEIEIAKGSQTVKIMVGDVLDILPEFGPRRFDACLTDPPYGLEFMGREWDKFRLDDPGTMRNRGDRVGKGGTLETPTGSIRMERPLPVFGGKRPNTSRCVNCGKRDQFRNPHACGDRAIWKTEPIDPHAAPPTALAFGNWCRLWALEVLRVLRPGAHALTFGGARTFHRLTCGLEDAGFEIRDCLSWLYASGFPKNLNISKAIDKAAGAEREVIGPGAATCQYIERGERCPGHGDDNGRYGETIHTAATAPATELARRFEGYGTALKPAWEPIVLAMKPREGSFARGAEDEGVAGMNIDGSRIEVSDRGQYQANASGDRGHDENRGRNLEFQMGCGRSSEVGRYPSNLLLDEGAARLLDRQSGDETGGPISRFFYVAKASTHDRGSRHIPPAPLFGETEARDEDNDHPTVKPTELATYLARLLLPPRRPDIPRRLLVPFAGSGSEVLGALRVGWEEVVAIEKDPGFAEIARKRIERARGSCATW